MVLQFFSYYYRAKQIEEENQKFYNRLNKILTVRIAFNAFRTAMFS